MAGAHVLAGSYGQSKLAGSTAAHSPAPTVEPTTFGEALRSTPLVGELDHMLSGGSNDLHLFEAKGTALIRNTELRVGPHGGTVTAPHSGANVGPAASAKRLFEQIRARF